MSSSLASFKTSRLFPPFNAQKYRLFFEENSSSDASAALEFFPPERLLDSFSRVRTITWKILEKNSSYRKWVWKTVLENFVTRKLENCYIVRKIKHRERNEKEKKSSLRCMRKKSAILSSREKVFFNYKNGHFWESSNSSIPSTHTILLKIDILPHARKRFRTYSWYEIVLDWKRTRETKNM